LGDPATSSIEALPWNGDGPGDVVAIQRWRPSAYSDDCCKPNSIFASPHA
jgi:hypothetical protein